MAYVLKRIGTTPNTPYRHFECDEINDLVTIDLYLAPMGSTCYVINTGDMYKLNGDNEWVLMPSRNTSWNDLADKPFGEIPTGGDTLTWDGNTDGLVSVGPFYKVSDAVVTLSDIVSGITFVVGDNSITVAKERIEEIVPGVLFTDGVVFVEEEAIGVDADGIVFPESGIYFITEGEADYSLTIPGYTGFPGIKKLDAKYLPDSVSIPKPIPYDYMPEGYPKVDEAPVIYELKTNLPESDFSENESGTKYAYLEVIPAVELKPGEKYIVTLNGVKYECVADGYTDESNSEVSIGNAALDDSGDDSGEPFFMYYNRQVFSDSYTSLSGYLLLTILGDIDLKVMHRAEEFVCEQEFLGEDANDFGEYFFEDELLAVFVPGERYEVTVDGDVYECVAWSFGTVCYLGNGSLWDMTGGGDEPFVISYEPGAEVNTVKFDTPGDHQFNVVHLLKGYTKIDEKFLPDSIKGSGALVITEDRPGSYTANMPFAEAYDSIISGIAPILVRQLPDYVLSICGFNSLQSSYDPNSTYNVMRLCFNNENGQRYVNFTSDGSIYEPGES